ncbi:hypothetical protein E2542_SST15092 [Spatholobus suberectus]|nr:hypothetical protein E2542_SST15092 [Spatholobus suberectus]
MVVLYKHWSSWFWRAVEEQSGGIYQSLLWEYCLEAIRLVHMILFLCITIIATSLISVIKQLAMDPTWNFSLFHSFKEANQCADHLAKRGAACIG